jgi:ATP sulfurylase
LNVLGLANVYKVRPSTLLDIVDPYTAYCFDEACAYITGKLEQGEEPRFKKKYKSFKDIYAQYK